jgi:O-antigen/teichoic acid export membrane protein
MSVHNDTVSVTSEARVAAPEATAAPVRSHQKPYLAVVGRAVGVLSAFLVTAVLARLLPRGSFGDFNMLLTLLTPMSWWAVLGLNASAVRLLGEEQAYAGAAGANQLTRRMLATALYAALAAVPLVAGGLWFGTRYLGFPLPDDPWLHLLFALTVGLFGFQLVVADCFYGHHAVGLAPLFTGGLMAGPVTTLLFLLFFICSAMLGTAEASQLYTKEFSGTTIVLRQIDLRESLSLLLAALCCSLPLALALLRRTLAALPTQPERASCFTTSTMVRVSLSLLGLGVAAYFLTVFVDVAIAGKVFGQGTTAFDLYSAARRLMFMAFITPQLAGSLASPAVAQRFFSGRREELRPVLRKYARYGALPAVAIAVVLLIAPGPLLGAYLGDTFAAAASTTQVLALAPLFAAWSGLGGYALAVTGYQRYCIAVNVLAGLFVLLAGIPAAQWGGPQGLAWICVTGFTLKHAAEWLLARRLLGVWCQIV